MSNRITNIFPLKAIHQLIAGERELNTSRGKGQYIKRCFQHLNEYLISHFNSGERNYLFHRAFYIYNKKLHPVELANRSQDRDVAAAVDFIETKIQQNAINLSFTQLLNDSLKSGLCLYNDPQRSAPLSISSDFLCFSMLEDRQSKLEKFLGVKPGILSGLLQAYGGISYKKTPIYVYFIRPLTKLPHYNGTFNLILKRALTEAELTELGMMWTKVLSDTAMVEGKEEVQDRIFEEYTHSSRTEISSLSQYLMFIEDHLKEHAPEAYQDIKRFCDAASVKTQQVREAIEFNLYLMKTGQSRSSFEDMLGNASLPEITDVNLNELLCEIVDNMIVVLSANYIPQEKSNVKITDLKRIRAKLAHRMPVHIPANRIGLSIIFTDLLKNALAYSGDLEPRLDIEISTHGIETSVHFINGLPIAEDAFKYINQDEFDSNIFLTSRYGIRTIKRIINSSLFTNEKYTWKFKATDHSKSGPTNIYIKILKN